MKKMKVLLAMALSMLLLAGCGGDTAKSDDASQKGPSISQEKDIKAAIDVDFTTMDPVDTSDTLSGGVQRMIMDGFFGFDDKMKIIPMLATGYEANPEATVFTLTLRKGVTFSDGEPWNADAAIANVHKWMDKSLGLKRSSLLSGVIEKVEKIDDYKIKITLNKPFGAFISNLAHPATVIMSPKQIAAGVATTAKAPIGTGQYILKEWVPGDHLTLELNKNWWGYDPKLTDNKPLADKDAGFKSVTFKPVAEGASRVAMLQAGDANIIWPVPTESFASLETDKNVKVFKDEGIVVRYLFMNTQKKPFTDLKVREAINYAIDKDAYIKIVKNGLGTKATSVIGPAVQFYKKNDPVPYDPTKAKQLLAEAGYPNGFTTTLMYSNTSSNQKQAEFFKQQLAQVGITVNLNSMENAVLNQKVQGSKAKGADAEVELYMSGWSPSTGDADWGIRPLLAIESEPPASYNISYFEDPNLEGQLKIGLGSADPKVRGEAYAKAQDLIWKQLPMIFLANDLNTWATTANISGVLIYPDNAINMRNGKMFQ